MRLVVTGAPRSGTTFLARMLDRVAEKGATHEKTFTSSLNPCGPIPQRWYADVDVSCFAVPFVDRLPDDVQIVRLVRNPVHCIFSIWQWGGFDQKNRATWNPLVAQYFKGACGFDRYDGTFEAACEFWILWDSMLKNKFRWVDSSRRSTFQVESFRTMKQVIELAQIVGVDCKRLVFDLNEPLEMGINKGAFRSGASYRQKIELEDIPYQFHRNYVRMAMEDYGYF